MVARTSAQSLPRISITRAREVHGLHSTLTFLSGGIPRRIFLSLLVALGYYLGTRIGLYLTPHALPISTFWPPNAVLLGAFLLAPRSMWWIFLLAVFPAHMFIQLRSGIPLATACGWFVGNSAEALLGAACIRHFKHPDELFENVHGVFTFVGFGSVLAPLATSFVDAGVVVTTGFGNGYWKLWITRLFSNMLADITIAPTMIVLALKWRSWTHGLTRQQRVEGISLALAIVAVSLLIFGTPNATMPALMFVPLPLLVWMVVRIGVVGLYPSLLAISYVSIWNAANGRDPFVAAPKTESILGIQIFLCTIALPMMLLAAVLAEREAVGESLRQSRARLFEAQEQERRRIARELHDDIGQQLTLIQLDIDQLRGQSGEGITPRLDRLYDQVSVTAASTRTLSHELHSTNLELLGLVPALRNLCQTVAQETAIEIAFTEENVPLQLDPQISLCLYRVAQEALHNVARHSHAHKAGVQIQGGGKQISLQIIDDGIGIAREPEHTDTLGLASMRERVGLAGGTFKIISQPMRGTSIETTVPLKASQF